MKKILLLLSLAVIIHSCHVEVRIDGCTDPVAYNYDSQADDDDGTCQYYGCTDPLAYNYNPQAGVEDESCLYTTGCMDPAAVNYDPQAIIDDGSCLYISGCTDQSALNYNPEAAIEPNNACEYTCDVVYYLDYSAVQYMLNWGISFYSFYDYNGSNLGYITNDYYWNSPPNCLPQSDGSTLTASLYWSGNYGNNTAIFSWSAYPDDGPIADYDGTFVVYPNECARVELSKKKIKEYKASK